MVLRDPVTGCYSLPMSKYIAKCGKGHTVLGTGADLDGGWLRCGCGSVGVAKGLKIVVNDRKCGSVCQGATGPACSCSCGGESHGATGVFA